MTPFPVRNPGKFINRLGSFLRQGPSGFMTLTRGISQGRMITLPSLLHSDCQTWETLSKATLYNIKGLEESGVFRSASSNRVSILTSAESACCGQFDYDEVQYKYPASNTLPIEFRTKLAALYAEQADRLTSKIGETVVFSHNTSYNTGLINKDGKEIIVISTILTAGEQGTIIFDKSQSTTVDGLNDNQIIIKAEAGLSPSMLAVKDFCGDGDGILMGGRICVELMQPATFSINNDFGRRPDIVVVCGYACPTRGSWKVGFSKMFVNDGLDSASRNPMFDSDPATGAYQPATDNKLPEGFLTLNEHSSYFAKCISSFMSYISISPSRVASLSYSKIGGLTKYPGGYLESPTIDIPSSLNEVKLDTVISDIMSTRISMGDPSGAIYDPNEQPQEIEHGLPPFESPEPVEEQ